QGNSRWAGRGDRRDFHGRNKGTDGCYPEADSTRVQDLSSPPYRHHKDAAGTSAAESYLARPTQNSPSSYASGPLPFSPPRAGWRKSLGASHRWFGVVGFVGLWTACWPEGGGTCQDRTGGSRRSIRGQYS